ncbi:SubName: Full=Uncharacterized protein {ECO:0000313/EMBL:CCA75315.1} [Serendipita indica DSM 11827]|nr:SubName: Full=Uncharacterized protein {ECO:0000313/EMBL:CCA75315.1} [Serendipita indica DSM 11827]
MASHISPADVSPAPIQTFHKPKVHVPGTHLLSGVSGAAHVSSSTPAAPEQNPRPDSPTAHRRSLSMSNPHIRRQSQDSGLILEGKRKQVLEDVIELFCSRPTLEIFQRSWREDAVFEDPLSKCEGYPQYAAQWFGMPKAFPQSVNKLHRVLSSTHNPNRIVYYQEQEYTIRGLGTKKLMKSTVVIELDDDDKIVKLDDKWNSKEHPTNFVAMFFRRLNARTMPWLVSVPKLEKTE